MTSFRRAAVCLALVAMMLRGLMPAGWMPNPDGAGTSLFVICDMDQGDMSKMDMSHMDMPGMNMSGMDMAQMDMSAMGHDPAHKPASDNHQHEACPFAAAPHVATLDGGRAVASVAVGTFLAATGRRPACGSSGRLRAAIPPRPSLPGLSRFSRHADA